MKLRDIGLIAAVVSSIAAGVISYKMRTGSGNLLEDIGLQKNSGKKTA